MTGTAPELPDGALIAAIQAARDERTSAADWDASWNDTIEAALRSAWTYLTSPGHGQVHWHAYQAGLEAGRTAERKESAELARELVDQAQESASAAGFVEGAEAERERSRGSAAPGQTNPAEGKETPDVSGGLSVAPRTVP